MCVQHGIRAIDLGLYSFLVNDKSQEISILFSATLTFSIILLKLFFHSPPIMYGTSVLGEDGVSNVGRIGDGMMLQTAPTDNSLPISRIGDIAGSQSGNDQSIHEAYHFEETSNYGVWFFKIEHALKSSELFDFCMLPSSFPASLQEREARARVMGILITPPKIQG